MHDLNIRNSECNANDAKIRVTLFHRQSGQAVSTENAATMRFIDIFIYYCDMIFMCIFSTL